MKVRWRRLTPDPFFFLCPLVLSTNAKLVCPKPFTPSQVYLKRLRITHQFFFLDIYRQIFLWINHELKKQGYLPRFSLSTFAISSLLPGHWTLDNWTTANFTITLQGAETMCVIAMAYLDQCLIGVILSKTLLSKNSVSATTPFLYLEHQAQEKFNGMIN